MKMILLSTGTENRELLQELKQLLSNTWNNVEEYVLNLDNLQKIQSAVPDLVLTVNLSGFEFTTLTGGISFNLWNTKFIHFLLDRNLPNEKYLGRPLSVSMFFYCSGREYKEYLQKRYPEIPYLEEIGEWKEKGNREDFQNNAKQMAAVVYHVAKKCGISFHLSLSLEAELFFHQLKIDQKETDVAWQYINSTLDAALAAQDDLALLSLIPYIESGKGKLAWQYVGETHRILRILHIVRLEIKYELTPFFVGCASKEELTEKYLTIMFALRRLAFCLSEESVAEAGGFLKSACPSPFSLHIILQEELLPRDLGFYHKVAELFEGIWNREEMVLFNRLAEAAGKE